MPSDLASPLRSSTELREYAVTAAATNRSHSPRARGVLPPQRRSNTEVRADPETRPVPGFFNAATSQKHIEKSVKQLDKLLSEDAASPIHVSTIEE
jgi:hypothetical protein